MRIDRRTFSKLAALAAIGAAVPVEGQKKLNIRIGHTGITWPWGNPPGPGPMRLADPAAIEQIVKDIAGLGFYGIELFGWQIDGMEAHGGLGPLQQAMWDSHSFQCGFCTPGFVMQATAYLSDHPDAGEQEIREALSGNICRCTGYQSIIDGVLLAEQRSRES